jgi:eukaryotic-like serine/threonine-protein kinase
MARREETMKNYKVLQAIACILLASLAIIACSTSSFFPTATPRPTDTPVPTPTPTPNPTQRSPIDGMLLVYVPEGDFRMGSTAEQAASFVAQCVAGGLSQSNCDTWGKNEQPQHTVWLDAFWIDRTEVTNGQFAQCEAAGNCKHDRFLTQSETRGSYYGNAQYANFPVVSVDWKTAKTYCEWAGRRLPTEAEWEKAARGTDGRAYPWGEMIDCSKANYAGKEAGKGCVGDTTEAGSYPSGASPYGALDMAGNVNEWVADWFGESYYSSSPARNPPGPKSDEISRPAFGIRGGSYNFLDVGVRSALRNGLDYLFMSPIVGFRCAVSP